MEQLTSEQLRREQEKTLSSPRMRYGLLARPLFLLMDLLYGRKRTLSKFKVRLEWEKRASNRAIQAKRLHKRSRDSCLSSLRAFGFP